MPRIWSRRLAPPVAPAVPAAAAPLLAPVTPPVAAPVAGVVPVPWPAGDCDADSRSSLSAALNLAPRFDTVAGASAFAPGCDTPPPAPPPLPYIDSSVLAATSRFLPACAIALLASSAAVPAADCAACSAWATLDCAMPSTPASPLMSRNMLPFWMAARIAVSPAGSGAAGGLTMFSHGVPKPCGWSDSAASELRLPATSGAMSGASTGIGESAQFQKRVRSSFSALFERPSTASAKTPPLGSETMVSLRVPVCTPRSCTNRVQSASSRFSGKTMYEPATPMGWMSIRSSSWCPASEKPDSSCDSAAGSIARQAAWL